MGESTASGVGRGNGIADQFFAVLDVETTGVFASHHDRIIEVAVVVIRGDGRVQDEFVTLVNPNRDVGPTRIHGITASDVAAAPTFGAVAGDVVERLRGTVVAGHNVRFDEGFIRAECQRIDLDLPAFPTVCTLNLVTSLGLDVPSRRLADCCRAVGVDPQGSHSALGDARAAAGLLMACFRIGAARGSLSLADLGCTSAPSEREWPSIPRSGLAFPRGVARNVRASVVPFLARVVASLPFDATLPGNSACYMDALDRALEDRLVTAEEADALLDLAKGYGLSRGEVEAIHRRYYLGLHKAALADGQITDMERRDLDSVAQLLGVDESSMTAREQSTPGQAMNQVSDGSHAAGSGARLARADLTGKSVCFTGELSARVGGDLVTRKQAEDYARNAGLVVASAVTKSLDVLVLADPLSMSSKAKKARKYGTRILAEAVFWAAIGVDVDCSGRPDEGSSSTSGISSSSQQERDEDSAADNYEAISCDACGLYVAIQARARPGMKRRARPAMCPSCRSDMIVIVPLTPEQERIRTALFRWRSGAHLTPTEVVLLRTSGPHLVPNGYAIGPGPMANERVVCAGCGAEVTGPTMLDQSSALPSAAFWHPDCWFGVDGPGGRGEVSS